MSEHFKTLSAVLPVVIREHEGREEVLLLRRANTTYMDGKWDLAGSGHVEEGETASQAVCRELFEETGLIAKPEDAVFVHVRHRIKWPIYYDFYFEIRCWEGEPSIREPEKCDGMAWFPVDALPEDMIPNRRTAFLLARDGVAYSEIVYHDPEEEEIV
ncbi:MAG: NUDIX domain-containing protein [Oscillospiraceae bacterium]|nr:NUDIX domain-containing protein [Oscillospiraceae bacterium]